MSKTYIVDEGIRIGFFMEIKDAQDAMLYCKKGFVVTKERWEQLVNYNQGLSELN